MSALDDRLLGPLRRLVRQMTARVDYFASYSAIVNTDNGDGTLDITPEDSRLHSMSGIPKLHGLPGVVSTVAQNAKVVFVFQNGDPSKPAVVLYDATAATKVSLQGSAINLAADPGAAAVGRVGDQVKVTLTPANIATMVIANGGGTVVATNPVDVVGTITAGSPKVSAS